MVTCINKFEFFFLTKVKTKHALTSSFLQPTNLPFRVVVFCLSDICMQSIIKFEAQFCLVFFNMFFFLFLFLFLFFLFLISLFCFQRYISQTGIETLTFTNFWTLMFGLSVIHHIYYLFSFPAPRVLFIMLSETVLFTSSRLYSCVYWSLIPLRLCISHPLSLKLANKWPLIASFFFSILKNIIFKLYAFSGVFVFQTKQFFRIQKFIVPHPIIYLFVFVIYVLNTQSCDRSNFNAYMPHWSAFDNQKSEYLTWVAL